MTKMVYAQKYWFAVGYHHGMSNIIEPPSKETVSYFQEMHDVSITKEYEQGRKAGTNDKSKGYE